MPTANRYRLLSFPRQPFPPFPRHPLFWHLCCKYSFSKDVSLTVEPWAASIRFALSWWGQSSLLSVLSDQRPSVGKQGSSRAHWAWYGEVEGAPFLEVEKEEVEEPAVKLWLTKVWWESCCHDHCFTPLVLYKSSRICCFPENLSEVSMCDTSSSSRAGK